MKIARIELVPLRLPLRRVLTLPRGTSRTLEEGKRLILVRLETEDGRVGWGEASPSRRWSAETLESALTSLHHYLVPAVVGRDPRDLPGLHAAMDQELAPGFDRGQPIAKAALDFACHDLVARSQGLPVQALLGRREPGQITLAYLVSAPTPEEADAFLKDDSKDAYEKAVDRLLASPRYGERMVWEWLDAARYADSNGYQGDAERTMSMTPGRAPLGAPRRC